MAWQIEFTSASIKQLKKLGPEPSKTIIKYLRQNVSTLDNPRQLGKVLKGSKLGNLWRYRVGDYRILCELQDDKLVILIVEVGNRKDIYKR